MADAVLTFRPGTVADIPGFRALGEAVVPPTYGPIDAAYAQATTICAVLLALGGAISWVTIRNPGV